MSPKIHSCLAFIQKEFYHIFRDIRTIMILILMPIVQILLFGFALGSEVKNTKFTLLDLAKSPLSLEISEHFKQNPSFSLSKVIHSPKELKKSFENNQIDFVLIFPSTNAQEGAKAQLIFDASDPNYASTLNIYASSIFQSSKLPANSFQESAPTDLFDNAQDPNQEENLSSLLLMNKPLKILPLSTMLFNPQGKSAYSFVPGLMG